MRSSSFILVIMLCISQASLTAIAGDYTLDIFGNANMDDTIDEADVEYVAGIIDGSNEATDLADANYDGVIDEEDIDQIEKIMADDESELTMKDYVGRIVTIEMPVERVALLNKYAMEAIQIFRVQDRVVGIETEAQEYTYLPEICSLTALGKASDPDFEAVVGLNPDLVITWYSTKIVDYEAALPDTIPIIDLSFTKPAILPKEVKTLGYIFGEVDRADYYIEEFHDKYIDIIESRVDQIPEDERLSVYLECNLPYKTYGNTTGAHQMMVLSGGMNIFDDIEGIPIVDPEEIIERNPAAIIRGAYSDAGYSVDDSSKMKELMEEIMSRPGFEEIAAVQDDNVYIVNVNLHYGLDYPVGLVYFAEIINPVLFEDLDPKSVHQEFLADVLGVDFDLDEHGVFVYPPLEVS